MNKTLSTYGWYPNGKSQYYSRYSWDDDMPNGWVQTLFDTSNQDGNNLETWGKTWNLFDNVYNSGDRTVNIYNATGNIDTSHEFVLEPITSAWLAYHNTIYSYSNGNIASISTYTYDINPGTWSLLKKEEFTYNGQGQLIFSLELLLSMNNKRITITYNSAGLLEEQVTQYYNDETGNWQNWNRFTRSYYPSGADMQELDFKWNNNQQKWVEISRDSMDESGNTLYRINKSYDVDDDMYYGGFLVEYTYDNTGLLTQYEVGELVFGTQNDWENLSLSTFSYDANGQIQEIIDKNWDAGIGDYVNFYRTYNFNTGCLFNSASTTVAKQAACYHSNPIKLGQPIYCTSFDSNEELSLSLYSMTGTLVSSGAFRSGDALSARAGVGPGMYVVGITNKKGEAYRAKLVVVE